MSLELSLRPENLNLAEPHGRGFSRAGPFICRSPKAAPLASPVHISSPCCGLVVSTSQLPQVMLGSMSASPAGSGGIPKGRGQATQIVVRD